MLSTPGDQYVEGIVARMSRTNPLILEFIGNFAKDTGDPKAAIYAGVTVYRMLESQQEADDLASEIGGKC
mgnify:CR=1 FL=1